MHQHGDSYKQMHQNRTVNSNKDDKNKKNNRKGLLFLVKINKILHLLFLEMFFYSNAEDSWVENLYFVFVEDDLGNIIILLP